MHDYPNRLGNPTPAEHEVVLRLLEKWTAPPAAHFGSLALQLTQAARDQADGALFDVQAFLAAFPIEELAGVSLLRLAEAVPRVSDGANQIALLADKLGEVDWTRRAAMQDGWIARAASSALAMAQSTLPSAERLASGKQAAGLLADTVVRPAVRFSVGRLGKQFVFAEAIEQALALASRRVRANERYSFDMLGEGARTWQDAQENLERYREALSALASASSSSDWRHNDGLSIKISAIHPRYEPAHYPREKAKLLALLQPLAAEAARHNLGLTIDAEESERLEMHLDLLAQLVALPELRAWAGLGVAVQAYQLRALAALDVIIDLARARVAAGGAPLALRWVKGAYWDSEIKRAQELALAGYAVFTQKAHTDLSYALGAAHLLAARDVVYPQFASHNAISLALVLALAQKYGATPAQFEFQRLHGMGTSVYEGLNNLRPESLCRVYAPVGDQSQLLAYLIRRLLENGASTSFVRKLADASLATEQLVGEESAFLEQKSPLSSRLPLPAELYLPERKSAAGLNLQDSGTLTELVQFVVSHPRDWRAAPIIASREVATTRMSVVAPARTQVGIGAVADADAAMAREAIAVAYAERANWVATDVQERARLIERFADAIEGKRNELIALCVWEAGKTLSDALADVREAVDLCRYYAASARQLFGTPKTMPGPTGESNVLTLHGRGVFVCISPWNFPVAIYAGQIAAALLAGNTVVAKPAEQTPLTAYCLARLLLDSGIANSAFQFVPGAGEIVGAALVADPRIAGVVFTGSNETARRIARTLAESNPAIVPFIAETGGQNAMIVDSTALPEQVVDAVVSSCFRSAGQRCSALRVLYLQEEIAATSLDMIRGAMESLVVGEPMDAATDVGPVIDGEARRALDQHLERMRQQGHRVHQSTLGQTGDGYFVAPAIIEIDAIAALDGEVFGPILHVIRYRLVDLDRVIDDINETGFGLTLGIHTRIEARAQYIRARVRCGNVYVNRNMIGAVVGTQPFGGEGKSGTGFKAGGPHYLLRFATERVYTVNTAAAGGDLALLAGANVELSSEDSSCDS